MVVLLAEFVKVYAAQCPEIRRRFVLTLDAIAIILFKLLQELKLL